MSPTKEEKRKKWPGECDDEIPGPFVTIPKQPSRTKPGQLTDEQIKEYFDVVCCVEERERFVILLKSKDQW